MCIFYFYCCIFLVFVLPSGVIKNDYVLDLSVRSSIRSFDCSSVTKPVNTTLWKKTNRFCCKLKRSTLRSGGKRPRPQDAEVRFGDLAEASFSTLLSSRFPSFVKWLEQNSS